MAEPWTDRLKAIGQNLLTLEINTLVTTGLSAQKMPEIPLALHTLVQGYADYLATAGFQVSTGLLKASALRVSGGTPPNVSADAFLRQLQSWPFAQRRKWTDAEIKVGFDTVPHNDVDDTPALELTNGAETFEALQWAAWAALQTARASGPGAVNADTTVLSRINANCRQLKEAALRLEHQQIVPKQGMFSWGSLQQGAAAAKTRLTTLVNDGSNSGAGNSPLFGATVEQTARALFDHPRPVFYVDPDVTILVRKAWDIGVKRVCLQTVMQVDGDILQVVGDLRPDEREFLTALHKEAVKTSVGQWQALFQLVLKLTGEIGQAIFRA
jgi:hypothetical protein